MFYLGLPGDLTALPQPTAPPDVAWTRRSVAKDTIGGGRQIDFAPTGLRTWNLTWDGIESADHTTLMAFFATHNGIGPWVMLDPQEANLLTANQSSTTSALSSTTGWTVAGTGGTIASSNTGFRRGPRCLKWTFATATPGTSTLTLAAQRPTWYGQPILPSTSYVFSAYLLGAGTDAVVGMTAQILWYSSGGTLLSTSSGSLATTSSSAWVQATVTATSSSTAAYALPRLSATSATIGAGSIVYVDEAQLEQASAVTTWQPGLGVPLVSWTEMPRTYPREGFWDMSATLLEVG